VRGLLNAALLPTLLGLGCVFIAAPGLAKAAELKAGSVVRVTGTDGNGLRVRSTPGVNSKVLATIKDGQRLEILDGPRTADGLDWYQVKSESLTGWSNAKYLTAALPERAPKSATPYDSELAAPMPPISAGSTFVAKTTGYATGNPGVGTRTATGTAVRWGVVAVDPTVIAFGSQLVIDGFDGALFIAEDRGSKVKGTAVDIFFPESAAAGKYGTQQRRVTVVREGSGR
jgi:3D (Asp-Asp-Asp) domain-containing protein